MFFLWSIFKWWDSYETQGYHYVIQRKKILHVGVRLLQHSTGAHHLYAHIYYTNYTCNSLLPRMLHRKLYSHLYIIGWHDCFLKYAWKKQKQKQKTGDITGESIATIPTLWQLPIRACLRYIVLYIRRYTVFVVSFELGLLSVIGHNDFWKDYHWNELYMTL